MSRHRRRKCRQCGQLYAPDPRNRWHQHYCSAPVCRRASKTAAQHHWRRSPKGRDYFRGSANVLRVQAWRKAHPGYARNRRKKSAALQDVSPPQTQSRQADRPKLKPEALQDFVVTQQSLLLGLVAALHGWTDGSALQDHMDSTTNRLILLGRQVQSGGGFHADTQVRLVPGTAAPSSAAIQLGRSPLGSG